MPFMKQTTDITDSIRDSKRIQNKESVIDLPEVRDIPGQEHVHVLPLGEMADTTISSDDEEGIGLLDILNEAGENETSNTLDVTPKEIELLDETELASSTDSTDETELRNEIVDKTDKDGELLNEESSREEFSGSDLDVPGTEEDDEDEEIGEEDEENNIYSSSQK
jgi:hypothetical protein